MLEPKKDFFWKLFSLLVLLLMAAGIGYILLTSTLVLQGGVSGALLPSGQDRTQDPQILSPNQL